MIHFLKRLSVFALITTVGFSFITGRFFFSGAYAQSTHTSADIEHFKQQAANDRAFAEKRRKQAEQWHKRAEEARRKSQESSDPAKKERRLKDAETYDRSVAQAMDDAEKAEVKAAQAEAEIRQMKSQITREDREESTPTQSASTASTSRASPAIPLIDVIGVWKSDETDSIFVIVPEDPELNIYAYKLEAHTRDRVWKGEYSHFDEGDVRRSQNARLVFKYKPKLDEMNPKIPKWARKSVEGELEWQIELNEAGTCGAPALAGYFFPGEVSWNEKTDDGPKSAKVTGRGSPRDIALSLQEFEPEEAFVSTSIRIRPPGLGTADDGSGGLFYFDPLEPLVEGQLFHVDVSLPYELAKEQGDKLALEIRGLGSGETETVELIRGAFRKGYPSKYTNYRPLFLGDSKPFLSERWLLKDVGEHAQNIDLDLVNGESVMFHFKDTLQIVPVYKNMEEYVVARYLEAANFLERLHRIRLVRPGATHEEREDAHVRLQRLKNFRILMTNTENPIWLRILIAEEYLGPVEEASQAMIDPEKIHGQGLIRAENVHAGSSGPGRYLYQWSNSWKGQINDWERVGDNDRQGRFDGIIWTNGYERLDVTIMVNKAWRERVKNAREEFMKDITLGLYEWAVSEAQVGYRRFNIGVTEMFAVASGTDHYGRKLSRGKRLEIIGSVLLANFTEYVKSELAAGLRDEIAGYQAPGDKLLTIRDVTRALRRRNVEKRKIKLTPPPRSQKNPKLPDTLDEKKAAIAAPVLAANKDVDLTQVVSCPDAPPRAVTRPDAASLPDRINHRFGKNAAPDTIQPESGEPQSFQTCNGHAVAAGAEVDVSDIGLLRLFVNNKDHEGKFKNTSREEHPFVKGFDEDDATAIAGFLGREVIHLPNGKKTSMQILKGLKENGWAVKLVIHARDVDSQNNKHALNVVRFDQDPDGCGLRVSVYDPDLHANVILPEKDLREILADHSVMLHRAQEGVSVPALPKRTYSASRSSPPRAKKEIKVEEFDPTPDDAVRSELTLAEEIRLYEERMARRSAQQLANDESQRPSWIPEHNTTLHGVVRQMPPEDRSMPIHVTGTEEFLGIDNSGIFTIPDGASFSHAGTIIDTAREGNVAIRVRPGHEGYVQFEKAGEARGLVPFYWPSGQHNVGERNTSEIPTRHLQYLDPGSGPGQQRWVDFSEGE